MRISDWSSDVCSSDLGDDGPRQGLEHVDIRFFCLYLDSFWHNVERVSQVGCDKVKAPRWSPAEPAVMSESRLALPFLNLGHALDHFFMLIFPTAVLALGDRKRVV